MQKSGILILFLGLILSSCNSLHIIDKPITYDEERKELSLTYLEKRYGIIKNEPSIDPQMIVVHWTAIAGFEKSFKLSILTLTNTVNSELFNMENVNFANLLTSSKITLIIFMIIGKIELISIFLIFKKLLFKD